MVYARFASGYRPGGPNTNAAFHGITRYKPDKTENYEIGLKGNVFDRALSFDASVYYIDWKDIQFFFEPPDGNGYLLNGGTAKSQGVELSVEARPLSALTISAWVNYSDAVLTQDFEAITGIFGDSGDRLPFSSEWSGNLSVDTEFPMAGSITAFAGGSWSYVGRRQSDFGTTSMPGRQSFPSYDRLDLRAGARYESWTLNLFINNVADERSPLTGGINTFVPDAFTYIQPRTVGLSLSKAFD